MVRARNSIGSLLNSHHAYIVRWLAGRVPCPEVTLVLVVLLWKKRSERHSGQMSPPIFASLRKVRFEELFP